VLVDLRAHGTDMRPGRHRARQQRERRGWRARGPVLVVDLIPAAARAQMLPQQPAGRRRQQSDVEIVPLHLHALPQPPRRRAVVGALDFDAAVEMDDAVAKAVVAKRFDGEGPDRRPFLGNLGGLLVSSRQVEVPLGRGHTGDRRARRSLTTL
jgi:hypothetical protein